MNRILFWAAAAATLAAGNATRADLITVGSGVNQAELVIEFSSGALFTFEVLFGMEPTDTVTGLGLFDIVESETTLTTNRQDFGGSIFIDGITFSGHSDIGFGGGEDWWHYWTMDADASEWSTSFLAANQRLLSDGDTDGWVYGKAAPPGIVPEHGTFVGLLAGALLLRCQR